jgi:hypothetical protein
LDIWYVKTHVIVTLKHRTTITRRNNNNHLYNRYCVLRSTIHHRHEPAVDFEKEPSFIMKNFCATCHKGENDENMDLLSCLTCEKNFHGFCVSIDDDLLNAILKCPNLTWRCDTCIGIEVEPSSNDNLDLILEKLQTMSSLDIEELKMQSLPKKTVADFFKNSETPRTEKRALDFDKMLQTAVKKGKFLEAPSSIPPVVMGIGAPCPEIQPVKPLKWLYVSNLHPETTENSVVKLISNKLKSSPSEFICVKLLPRNMLSPTFISFKIGMEDQLFIKTMNPDIWPNGIAIREFIERPRNYF